MNTPALRELHATLDRRARPEDVAQLVLDSFADLYTAAERRTIGTAAGGALRHHAVPFTSMSQDFARPVGFAAQLAVAHALFDTVPPVPAPTRTRTRSARSSSPPGARSARRSARATSRPTG